MPHGGSPRTKSARFQSLRYSTTFLLSPAAPVSCGMNMSDLDGSGAGGGDEEAGSAAFGGLGGISGGIESLIALAIGNTRARVGLFEKGDLRDPVSITIGVAGSDSAAAPDPVTAAELVVAAVRRAGEAVHNSPVVVSSVNPAMADRICTALEGEGLDVYRVGVEGGDLPIPMAHALEDASTLGQDRLVCAFGAYRRSRQACVVIDAGTAITVDFVDGEGTFQGGLIAPGVAMMLRSLSENTAQLPRVALTRPDPSRGVFGKDTRHAMLLGCVLGARGLVRHAIERFADSYGAYPQIVATGGDAVLLFEDDDLVEHIVPDLQLMGLYEVAKASLEDEDAPGPSSRRTPLDEIGDGGDDDMTEMDDGDEEALP